MKLKEKVKPAVPPLEAGVYMAVCVTVADLGDQYSEKYKHTSRKVAFSFDIPDETIEIDGERRPRQLLNIKERHPEQAAQRVAERQLQRAGARRARPV